MEFFIDNALLIAVFLVSGAYLLVPMLRGGAGGVSTLEATQLMNRGALVLDIREAKELSEGTLKQARHVPLAELKEKAAKEFLKYKKKPVVLICASGMRSKSGVEQLKKEGFEQVYSLEGGFRAWVQAGLPTVKTNFNT